MSSCTHPLRSRELAVRRNRPLDHRHDQASWLDRLLPCFTAEDFAMRCCRPAAQIPCCRSVRSAAESWIRRPSRALRDLADRSHRWAQVPCGSRRFCRGMGRVVGPIRRQERCAAGQRFATRLGAAPPRAGCEDRTPLPDDRMFGTSWPQQNPWSRPGPEHPRCSMEHP